MVSTKESCKETEAMNKKKVEDELAMKLAHDIHALCAAGCGEVALERCSLCAGAKYCGRKCQRKHWRNIRGCAYDSGNGGCRDKRCV